MLYGELAAITNAYQNGSWGSLSHHWLSTMLQPGLLVQTAADPSSWAMSLGDLQGTVALGWPVQEIESGAGMLYTPRVDVDPQDLHWLVVTDPTKTLCMEVEWLSPLTLHTLKATGIPDGFCGIVGRPRHDPQPLLKCAARACFWKYSDIFLGKLVGLLGLDVDATDLTSKLTALLNHILSPTDEELLSILRLRIVVKDDVSNMFHEDVIEEAMPDDQQVFKQCQAAAADTTQSDKIVKVVKELAAKVREKASLAARDATATARSRGRGRGRGGQAKASSTRPSLPSSFPDAAAVNEFLPPGCRAYRHSTALCWQSYGKIQGTVSRSVGLYGGERQAQLQLILGSWEKHELLGGLACPWSQEVQAELGSLNQGGS